MSLAGFSVRNSVLVNILMITILVLGTLSFMKLPRELIRQVSLNWAVVVATYPGASPKEMEQLVAIPIEEEIRDLEGIDFISIKSGEGFCIVDVKFEEMSDANYRYAIQELKSRVDGISDLPDDVDSLEVNEFDSSDVVPVINITVSGSLPERELRAVADDLADRLQDVPHISQVDKMGMRDREIWVEVDPQRLYNFGLTFPQVMQALASKNMNVPGGKLRSGRSEFLIRTVGEIDGAGDLKPVILRQTPGGRSVSVDDVAQVRETYSDEIGTISRLDGRPSITLSISKSTKGNSLDIIDEIKEIAGELSKRLHGEVNFAGADGVTGPEAQGDRDAAPQVSISLTEIPGSREHFLKFTSTYDSSVHIRDSLGALQNNAVGGMALVLLLLYYFLGWRYSFMAALGMTISFLGTFIFMYYMGESFNGNSLFGLVLVMGIVVDDAIIILENCYRYLQSGFSAREAAVRGTDEVVAPVVSATLTSICAFLPLMLLPGVIGDYMRVIPMVVSMALAASMVEAFIILPTHVAEWSGHKPPQKNNLLLRGLNHIYPRILRTTLHFRYLIVAAGLCTCLISGFLIPSLGVDFFEGEDLPRFLVFVEMPTGTSLEVTDEVLKRYEAEAQKLPREDVDAVVATSGFLQNTEEFAIRSDVGQMSVDLKQKKHRKHSTDELIDMLRSSVSHISGPRNVRFVKMVSGPPTGKPVEIKVKGKEFATLKAIAGELQNKLRKIPGVHDVGDDFSPGKQEIRIHLDEDKAALFGLNVAQVARTVQAAYLGGEASIWRDGDEEVKILVKLQEAWRRHPEDLLRLKIGTSTGVQVPLGKIARLEIEPGYSQIRRFNSERAITVHAEVDKKTTAVEVNTSIEQQADDLLSLYPGYRLDFQGEFKAFRETFDNLRQLFIVGLFLIYLILSGQFRSFVQPLIILFTIPFAFLGAMVGLVVLGASFTTLTMYAIVALAGIAVNDAIVLISFINNARERGTGKYESLMEAGILRLRPIILTSVTTIGGLLPMTLGLGGHSEVWAPLANTIVWGLLFATILTLLIIPAVYMIIVDDIATPLRRRIRSTLRLPDTAARPEYEDPQNMKHTTPEVSR